MLQLDGTIVNVALPTLQDDLGIPVTSGSWVPNAFLLAFGGLLLFAGRLGDVLGHRKVFLGGIGLVVTASLLAGLAPDMEVLLVGRVLQGAGAAIAGPTGLALLAAVFEGERRQRAFGADPSDLPCCSSLSPTERDPPTPSPRSSSGRR